MPPWRVINAHASLTHPGAFRACARDCLAYLRQRMAFDVWMVTRVEGNDWIVLEALGDGYGLEPGQVLAWDQSLCARMVDGRGPRIAPDLRSAPGLCDAGIARQLTVRAYVGIPLMLEDGHLFGTLCGMHSQPFGDELRAEAATLELIGRLLGSIVQAEVRAGRAARQAERYREQALSDDMTGLYNRRGWDLLLAAEDERSDLFGHDVAVVIMDLDELKRVNDTDGHAAGDQLLQRAAGVLEAHAREDDIIARLGGDEFGLIVTDVQSEGLEALATRFTDAFRRAGVKVSLGASLRTREGGLREAWTQADARMYLQKRAEAERHSSADADG